MSVGTHKHKDQEEPEVKLVWIVMPDGSRVQGSLPLLKDIQLPPSKTKSHTIRWLWAVGFSVQEISNGLGIKYQMVRNIAYSEPKRAAREDLGSLDIRLKKAADLDDEDFMIQQAMDGALEASLMVGRKERAKKAAQIKMSRGYDPDHDHPDQD